MCGLASMSRQHCLDQSREYIFLLTTWHLRVCVLVLGSASNIMVAFCRACTIVFTADERSTSISTAEIADSPLHSLLPPCRDSFSRQDTDDVPRVSYLLITTWRMRDGYTRNARANTHAGSSAGANDRISIAHS